MFRTLYSRFTSGAPAPTVKPAPAPKGTRRHFPTVYPREMAIEFSVDNPRKEGSAAWGRYNHYCQAVTIGEALERGATYKEIDAAFSNGACKELAHAS